MASLSKSGKSQPKHPSQTAAATARARADELVAQGMVLHRQGDLEGADKLYHQAIEAFERHAQALFLKGTVQLQRKIPDLAEFLLRKSLSIDPNQPQALGNLGLALGDLRRRDEAIEVLRSAVRMQPDSPDLQANLARMLRERGYFLEAAETYRKAIAMAPKRPALYSALGVALTGAEKHDEAVEAHRKALELAPEKPELLNNYAQSLRKAKREAEAEELLRRVVELAPDSAGYRTELGRVLHESGKYGEAIGVYRQARDMGTRNQSVEAALLFFQNHLLDNDPKDLKEDAIRWSRRASEGGKPYTSYPNEPDPDRRIRVGLVSADFHTHPVGRFLEAPLREFDRSRTSLYAYSSNDFDDPINRSLKRSIPNWRTADNVSDADLAAQIREDRIDVLIDLSGHTGGHRLTMFALKPAPVSATWLGYFATTGVEAIDYVICNRWLIPPEEEYQWVEKPWRMPSAHWCYYRPNIDIAVAPTPALQNGYVTFGCYNNFDKLNRETIGSWAEIMRRMPDCRMLLRSSNQNMEVKQRVIEAFAAEGFEPGERLVIDTTAMDYPQHMDSYGKLDIALDPFPYNGGTTTVEAFYMGVPVLTRHGDRFVAHMAESNVRSAGLDDWVAMDTPDYIDRAVEFASDIPSLAKLRAGLRAKVLASPLFEAKAFARDLENAFRGMWQAWCAQQPGAEPVTKSSAS